MGDSWAVVEYNFQGIDVIGIATDVDIDQLVIRAVNDKRYNDPDEAEKACKRYARYHSRYTYDDIVMEEMACPNCGNRVKKHLKFIQKNCKCKKCGNVYQLYL